MLELLAEDPRSLSSVRDPREAWRAHVADSLTGLEVSALRSARVIADVGSGAGFPGFVLAVALPAARIDLIESVSRKCGFMSAASAGAGIENVRVINARSEEHAAGAGREAYDVVTARAVGRLATLAELASPLLAQGGFLVAWKGRRDAEEEAELERAGEALAMEPVAVRWVGPFAGSRHRHLWLLRKAAPTPAGLPRRPGMAKKRPLGSQRGR